MRKLFVLISLSLIGYGCVDAQIIKVAGSGPGGTDTSSPNMFNTKVIGDTLVGTTGTAYAIFTITGSKPLFSFVVGDISTLNCSLSNFTTITSQSYTVKATPLSNGLFKIWEAAGVCTDVRGTGNNASDTVSVRFIDVSGYTYDLQNAASIVKSKHWYGHSDGSVADCSDETTATNLASGEMLFSKYNMSSTMNANGTSQVNKDIFSFGRLDYGDWLLNNYSSVDPLIQDVRQTVQTSVGSYKNGDDSYKAAMMPLVLSMRNSAYENVSQTLPTAYSGFTDVQLSSQGPTFRSQYYEECTGGNWYRCGGVQAGCQALGDSRITSYMATVISSQGAFTNFDHWAWASGYTGVGDYWEHYLEMLKTVTTGYDVGFVNYNTLWEYYFVKEAIDNVTGTGSTITVNYTKKYPSSPYAKIHTQAWIKLDLTGTGYATHGITTTATNGKIRSMGSNVYYVSCDLDFSTTSMTFSVLVNPTPSYVNLTPPVLSTSSNTVNSDQSVKYSLYSIPVSSVGTSTSSITIPTTHPTDVNFTKTGLTLFPGYVCKLYNDATHYVCGRILTYDSGTGAGVLRSGGNVGTGTFSSWTIYAGSYEVNVTLAERQLTAGTSWTPSTNITTVTTKSFYIAGINSDKTSAVIQR